MHWQEIRNHYPRQWLLIEAIKAHSESNKRILDNLSVAGTYPDSETAMKVYIEMHREVPERELYVIHSSRETVNITERKWLGIRA